MTSYLASSRTRARRRNGRESLIPPVTSPSGSMTPLLKSGEGESITAFAPSETLDTLATPGYVIKTVTAHTWIAILPNVQGSGRDNFDFTASMALDQADLEEVEGQEVEAATVNIEERRETPTGEPDDRPATAKPSVDPTITDWSKLSWIQRSDLTTLYHLRVPANTPSGFSTTGPYWPFQSAVVACKKVLEGLCGNRFAQYYIDNCDMLNARSLRAELGYCEDTPLPYEIIFDSLSGKEVVDAIQKSGPDQSLPLYLVRKSIEPPPVYEDLTSGNTLRDDNYQSQHGSLLLDVNVQRATAFGDVTDWDIDSVHLTASSANLRASALLNNWHKYFYTRELRSNLKMSDKESAEQQLFCGYLLGRKHEAADKGRLMGAVEVVKQDGFWTGDDRNVLMGGN